MNFSSLLGLIALIQLKRLSKTFVGIFGLIWLFIEPGGLFFPEQLKWGWRGYVGIVVLSLLGAITLNLPRRSISGTLSSPNSVIEIKVGNLFDESGHWVIGTNDVFDTELGEVIKDSSVQGQFLSRLYYGDNRRLDIEIDQALEPLKATRRKEPNKQRGKTWRYPVGSTIALGTPDKRYFLTAYGSMGNDLKVKATVNDIWYSLSCLWEQVRLKGHGLEVAIPIVGSDLARTKLPRTALIQLIILSFVSASKEEFVSRKLIVVIHPQDVELIDFHLLEDFLSLACF